jgi:hypothetical protein
VSSLLLVCLLIAASSGAPDDHSLAGTGADVQALRSASGWATWYRDPNKSGPYAATPWYRWGMDPEWVSVCAFPEGRTVCTNALVSDFCACGDRHGVPTLIDLAPSAFAELAPLSVGVLRVQVFRGVPAAPATDR